MTTNKPTAFHFNLGEFFKSKHFKHHFAKIYPKLARISPNLPEKTK